MWPNSQETADLVKFTEETLNGKLQFLCSDNSFQFSYRPAVYGRNIINKIEVVAGGVL